ncbi:DODA-type extradiol aromatic ring-opening family dioxygenase [Marinomonas transparens]|uniref:Dioxygenase n=1 Tax=Marinomonas transparens TaxID=2795388 RepID=A0A934JKL7_9GAMM|nr:class III extradiol ring-cleavage dioxygenase [Marinomonas transparens]MBJ7536098.1 dioxygenase [Marinomonas transparens]
MLPTYFISHGGGPWPYVEEMRAMLATLEVALADMPNQIKEKPKAILMISGHWERNTFGVQSNPAPGMEYDYYGFPPHTYDVKYAAPGSPEVASRVAELIKGAGFSVELDDKKGFDHGAFTPMEIMYPEADMPLVQLSLQSNLDPEEHLALGRALKPLRDEGVLIIGSGLSYHNLRQFGVQGKVPSAAFDAWLQKAVMESTPEQRTQALTDWEKDAPFARVCHPREDHFIPLMVAVGAAESAKATCVYHDANVFGGVTASSFRFD